MTIGASPNGSQHFFMAGSAFFDCNQRFLMANSLPEWQLTVLDGNEYAPNWQLYRSLSSVDAALIGNDCILSGGSYMDLASAGNGHI